MKINFLLLLYLLLLTFFIGCSDINDKVNNNSTTSEIENEEEADKFEGSLNSYKWGGVGYSIKRKL